MPPSKPPANQIFRDILASQGHSIMLSKLAPPLIRRFTAGKFKLALRALRVKHICKICAKVLSMEKIENCVKEQEAAAAKFLPNVKNSCHSRNVDG